MAIEQKGVPAHPATATLAVTGFPAIELSIAAHSSPRRGLASTRFRSSRSQLTNIASTIACISTPRGTGTLTDV
jgi:hypothetical protein